MLWAGSLSCCKQLRRVHKVFFQLRLSANCMVYSVVSWAPCVDRPKHAQGAVQKCTSTTPPHLPSLQKGLLFHVLCDLACCTKDGAATLLVCATLQHEKIDRLLPGQTPCNPQDILVLKLLQLKLEALHPRITSQASRLKSSSEAAG